MIPSIEQSFCAISGPLGRGCRLNAPFGVGEAGTMRRYLLLATVALAGLCNTGCFINAYSSDPNRRMTELINQSEDLRQIELEWERIWFVDQPSHLTPERVHGGIQ
jgi:hypothetical protein